MNSIYEDEYLQVKIKLSSGVSDTVILSFTGIGHAMGQANVQKIEFMGSLSLNDPTLIFVIDKTRSWGNSLDFGLLVSLVKKYSINKKIFCIGNSMGAFNAVVFSSFYTVEVCLGFVPQYSVSKDVVKKEDRWRSYTDKIRDFKFKELSEEFFCNETRYFFYSGSHYKERRHWSRFPNKSNIYNMVVEGERHDVASTFKKNGILGEVINSAFGGSEYDFWPHRLVVYRNFSS